MVQKAEIVLIDEQTSKLRVGWFVVAFMLVFRVFGKHDECVLRPGLHSLGFGHLGIGYLKRGVVWLALRGARWVRAPKKFACVPLSKEPVHQAYCAII